MKPGDLVTIPHGGERIGRVLAIIVAHVPGAYATVRRWRSQSRSWSDAARIVDASDCLPAPETDRRVKAVRKMEKPCP